jgi:hypothetical protein
MLTRSPFTNQLAVTLKEKQSKTVNLTEAKLGQKINITECHRNSQFITSFNCVHVQQYCSTPAPHLEEKWAFDTSELSESLK